MELRFIVNVSYNRFEFTDDASAMAFAEVAKRTAEDEDLRVEISIEIIKEEKKEGEDE